MSDPDLGAFPFVASQRETVESSGNVPVRIGGGG
jgi:hypothetical protein